MALPTDLLSQSACGLALRAVAEKLMELPDRSILAERTSKGHAQSDSVCRDAHLVLRERQVRGHAFYAAPVNIQLEHHFVVLFAQLAPARRQKLNHIAPAAFEPLNLA